jgi:hypothetical protein
MSHLKAQSIVQAIDDGYEADRREKARKYIGASIVGNPCDALLAYNLRGFPNEEPPPRLKRIFSLGHKLEDMVVKDLQTKANVRVWEVDGLTGRQHTYEAYGGHVVCHTDGHIQLDDAEDGELMILEVKSMNAASFAKFKDKGVKFSHPQYYAQMQMMMGMSGFQRSFFIAYCKDNSEYHAEIVDVDPFEVSNIERRVERVMFGSAQKISYDETDWRCRGCFKRGVCWGNRVPPKECSTCAFSRPRTDGGWQCTLTDTEAIEVCDQYQQYEPEDRK